MRQVGAPDRREAEFGNRPFRDLGKLLKEQRRRDLHARDVAPGGGLVFDGRRRLTEETKVAGFYERAIKEVLIDLERTSGFRLAPYYEPFNFEVSRRKVTNNGKTHYEVDYYPLDFIIEVNGRLVGIETHGFGQRRPKDTYLKRIKKFLKNHGQNFAYFVFSEQHIKDGSQPYVEYDQLISSATCTNAYVHMPMMGALVPDHETGKKKPVVSDEEFEEWKIFMKSFIVGIIELLGPDMRSEIRKAV